jgi:tetratricopeptide (TPR) repeat protein
LLNDDPHIYSVLGAVYFKMAEFDRSIEYLKKSISIESNYNAHCNLGVAFYFNAQYADAMTELNESISLKKNNYLSWGNLADVCRYRRGYEEEAEGHYRYAIQLAQNRLEHSPKDVVCRIYLAFYYAMIKDKEKALKEIEEVERRDPFNAEVLERSIYVYNFLEHRDLALDRLKKFIDLGGSVEIIKKDPDLSDLRSDPRFRDLIDGKR